MERLRHRGMEAQRNGGTEEWRDRWRDREIEGQRNGGTEECREGGIEEKM